MHSLQHEVYDLAKDGIVEEVRTYLKLGLDFCETPRRLPYEKIVIETEKMCKVIEDEAESKPDEREELCREAHKLREEVKKVLRKQKEKKMRSNLTKEEAMGKKKAYEDEEKVFLPADKGKVMVAMDKTIERGGEESYEYKMKKVFGRYESKTVHPSQQRLGSYRQSVKRRTRDHQRYG